ncbi:MAG TPA: choice-of-anchor B family protein [Fluviicola sp.]|nr:choice-of-anchor B family protein [Fluviicola sp.]
MNKLQLIFCFFILAAIDSATFAQNAFNVSLLDQWNNTNLVSNSSQVRYSDCYGFTHLGEEYAVIGSTEGTHVFKITPENLLLEIGFVRGRFSSSFVQHREFAVIKNYLYAVCDEGVSSLQIIDLNYLPDSIHLIHEDSVQFGRVHNIFIDTVQERLYSCIHRSTTNTQQISAPLKIFSLSNPLQPIELWSGPDDVVEVHDIHVRNGKAILNCGYDGLRVYDFTNTNNPLYLDSKSIYQDQGYNHQGWLTPDGKTYLFADETNGKRVKKCSFNGQQITIQTLFGTNYLNGSVPHNIKATNDFAFVAYYNEGLRIFDLSTPTPKEIAFFDSYPDESSFKMNGNWGIYADLPSERLLISDRQYGLFLLDFDRKALKQLQNNKEISISPNPVNQGESFMLSCPNNTTEIHWKVFDVSGNLVTENSIYNFNFERIQLNVAPGTYHLKLVLVNSDQTIQEANKKIVIL